MEVVAVTRELRSIVRDCHSIIDGRSRSIAASAGHLLDMCDRLESGEIAGEKAHRWVGYMQGVLVCLGVATFESMKALN